MNAIAKQYPDPTTIHEADPFLEFCRITADFSKSYAKGLADGLQQAYERAVRHLVGTDVVIPRRTEPMFTEQHWDTHFYWTPKDIQDLWIAAYETATRTGLCHAKRETGTCACGETTPFKFCEGRDGPRGQELGEIRCMHRGHKVPS